MFVDERNLIIKAGDGGDGIVSFRREKYIQKGGPDGGDGGDGGDIYIVASDSISLLNKYRENETLKAEDGKNGGKRLQRGKNGEDFIFEVPVGSVIYNKDTFEKFELLKKGTKVFLCAGGKGGLGNDYFKSSVNTTPTEFKRGEKGQLYNINIQLQLIADIGIIGLPNAGKSTLLNFLTNANAKEGSYAFTTLEPNLGVFNDYILADMPGLIEGAAQGKGIGPKFLKHIKRTKILLHLISVENEDIETAYKTIRKELKDYEKDLDNKKELVVITKKDLVDEKKIKEIKKQFNNVDLSVSAIDEVSLKELSEVLLKELQVL